MNHARTVIDVLALQYEIGRVLGENALLKKTTSCIFFTVQLLDPFDVVYSQGYNKHTVWNSEIEMLNTKYGAREQKHGRAREYKLLKL